MQKHENDSTNREIHIFMHTTLLKNQLGWKWLKKNPNRSWNNRKTNAPPINVTLDQSEHRLTYQRHAWPIKAPPEQSTSRLTNQSTTRPINVTQLRHTANLKLIDFRPLGIVPSVESPSHVVSRLVSTVPVHRHNTPTLALHLPEKPMAGARLQHEIWKGVHLATGESSNVVSKIILRKTNCTF